MENFRTKFRTIQIFHHPYPPECPYPPYAPYPPYPPYPSRTVGI